MESFATPLSGRRLLTVRELTRYVKGLLDADPLLQSVWVQGEISNFKWHHSGHIYFTLKDEVAQIKVVMFRSYANRLRFRPENGMQVIVQGNVTVSGSNSRIRGTLITGSLTMPASGAGLSFSRVNGATSSDGSDATFLDNDLCGGASITGSGSIVVGNAGAAPIAQCPPAPPAK